MSKQNNRAKDVQKYLLLTLKILWIPSLLVAAFAIGLYLGYDVFADEPATNVFSRDTWKVFIEQIKALK